MVLAAGWLVIRDGMTDRGQQGVEAGAALERGRLQVGLRLSSTFAAEAEDELSAVSLSRGAASLGIGGRLSVANRLSASAALHFGLALLSRTTRARGAEVMAAPPSRRLSPLLSPELRLHAVLHPELGLAVALGVGLDYLPLLPRLVYRQEEELQRRASPAILQPRLVLAIELSR